MRLYTRQGDDGQTALRGGVRVSKHDPRVTAYGEVDETNAAIGVVIAACGDSEITATLRQVQAELFMLGAELATPDGGEPDHRIGDEHITELERRIDAAGEEAPALRNFVLPGGTETAAALHLARAICRRAERAAVALARQQPVGPSVIVYLNRLSDLLFALARLANHRTGVADIPWIAPQS